MLKNFVREVRKKKGLSQLKLSWMTKIAPGAISNIENGKVFVYDGWKRRLSDALEVPKSVLFPGENKGGEVNEKSISD